MFSVHLARLPSHHKRSLVCRQRTSIRLYRGRRARSRQQWVTRNHRAVRNECWCPSLVCFHTVPCLGSEILTEVYVKYEMAGDLCIVDLSACVSIKSLESNSNILHFHLYWVHPERITRTFFISIFIESIQSVLPFTSSISIASLILFGMSNPYWCVWVQYLGFTLFLGSCLVSSIHIEYTKQRLVLLEDHVSQYIPQTQ